MTVSWRPWNTAQEFLPRFEDRQGVFFDNRTRKKWSGKRHGLQPLLGTLYAVVAELEGATLGNGMFNTIIGDVDWTAAIPEKSSGIGGHPILRVEAARPAKVSQETVGIS